MDSESVTGDGRDLHKLLANVNKKHFGKLVHPNAVIRIAINGKSAQTIANILSAASAVFKFAVTKEYMEYNPCTSVVRIKKPKKTPNYWSFAERNKFLAFCQCEDWELYQLVAFAVTTGLRPGELQGLQRSRLDFENCFVNMNYYHLILTRSDERVRIRWSFVFQRGSNLHSPHLRPVPDPQLFKGC